MEQPSAPAMTKRTWRFVWLAYWLVLFVLTHIPVSPHIPGIRNGDKLLHLIAYFVLTFLGGWAANRPVAPRFLAGWALVYAMYGVVDEYLQRFTGRSMTFGDLAADWLGIAVATAILWVTVRREPDRPCD